MRLIILLFILCIVHPTFSQNVEKKITPSELAQIIVDVLEELRKDLATSNLQFNESELEISAIRSFEGGGKLSVWVAKVGIDVSKETSATVTYQLSKLLQEAQEETIMLALLEKSINAKISDPKLKSQNFNELKSMSFQTEGFKGLASAKSYDDALNFVNSFKERRSDARRIINTKNVLVETIRQTIDDYSKMKAKFGEVKFDVQVAFSIEYSPGAEIEIGIFGAEAKGTKGWEHSIRLSFGSKS